MERKVLIQGDVILIPVKSVPDGTTVAPGPRGHVLAEGEVTGHAHVLEAADVIRDAEGILYATAREGAALRHEDHGPMAVAPGAYRVVRQTEPDLLGSIRQVAD